MSSNDNIKRVPVNKWDFEFSCDSKGLSVSTFIERVLEYKLFLRIQSVHSQMNTWSEFVHRIKEEYLPFDCETELWDEIRSRTHGSRKRVVLQLRKKGLAILPYYMQGVSLQEYLTVEELLKSYKGLEKSLTDFQHYFF
ncbi:hypothetical protein FQA39_LY16583 [Lamprigera yunnana]|nr:hypothetical protein FQA39_LY16583 [Lamprigera yunnana]